MDELDDIYLLLSEVFDRFFDEKYKDDQFLLWANKNDPVNKGLVFQKKKKVELEKIRQQQLFSLMKAQTDGYYFYDMEFEQKHKSSEDKELDKEKGLNNKPDMQAIRYDTDGNPSAWGFVEVKCTKMAYGGKSGLKEHVNKMRKYILDEENLKRRRREAYLIMSQYEKLKLEMFKKPLNDNDFANLPAEILLIFTDDAISEWTSERDESFVKLRNEQKIIKLDNNVDAIMVKV